MWMFQGVGADVPALKHLRHWQAVCHYLDAQPLRSVRYPFPLDPPMSARLFKRMARFRLVQHREDCAWRLSPRWRQILARLIRHAPADDAPASEDLPSAAPFIVATGVDTLYVNVLADGLPPDVVALCEQLKGQAQADNRSVATPWLFAGAPLSMLKSGKGTGERGGVSWGFLLRNGMAEVALRKVPVSGIVASVRLSSECLWVHGPRGALDAMRQALASLWGDRRAFKDVRFSLSQIHLCADVAHFALSPDLVPRVRTHVLNRAIYAPGADDLAGDGAGDDEFDAWDMDEDVLPFVDADDMGDNFDEDDEESDEDEDDEDDAGAWDDEGGMLHLRGQRVHGIRFAPGGALSAVWYDKALEGRRRSKPWMRAIHQAGGWEPGMVLTRVEVRFRRDVLRELGMQWASPPAPRWFDDPWVALDHLQDLWAFFAGLPPAADQAPDVNRRGWVVLTCPLDGDSNRSRWPVDPLWRVIQGAHFGDTAPLPLARMKQVAPDLDQIDAEIRGLLKTRAMLRGVYLHGAVTLTDEVVDFDQRMEQWDKDRGTDFYEEVRERARMAGKPLPLLPAGMLPLHIARKGRGA
jgi:hypothetical protein